VYRYYSRYLNFLKTQCRSGRKKPPCQKPHYSVHPLWQLAKFQLTRRIARSLGDSWASCTITHIRTYVRTHECIMHRRPIGWAASRCSIETAEWIKLVFGKGSSIDLLYTALKENSGIYKNTGTSLWNFVPNSAALGNSASAHWSSKCVIDLARERWTLWALLIWTS